MTSRLQYEPLPTYIDREDKTRDINDLYEEIGEEKSSILEMISNDKLVTEIPKFVPAWEGLRGIAVLMTTTSHVIKFTPDFKQFMGHGGVSIFFVLSGFLITGILVDKQSLHSNPRSSTSYSHLSKFYSARLIRLYPALLGMVLFTSVSRIIQNGWPRNDFYVQALLVLTYLSDIKYGKGPIWGNTWSLAVEEQFYVLWSLMLPTILLKKYRPYRTFIMLGLILPSLLIYICGNMELFGLPEWLTGYASPFSTVWKMFIGAWIRLNGLPKYFYHRRASWCGLTLLTLVILTCCTFKFATPRVLQEPLAVLSAALIICGSMRNGNVFLEKASMRLIGRVSYSFYLYQRPIQYLTISGNMMTSVATACLAFVLALASTFWFEEPIRNWYHMKHKNVVSSTVSHTISTSDVI